MDVSHRLAAGHPPPIRTPSPVAKPRAAPFVYPVDAAAYAGGEGFDSPRARQIARPANAIPQARSHDPALILSISLPVASSRLAFLT